MNMLQCLGYIEQRTDEMLQMHEICQNKEEILQHKVKFFFVSIFLKLLSRNI